jgi:hypothetical protein
MALLKESVPGGFYGTPKVVGLEDTQFSHACQQAKQVFF